MSQSTRLLTVYEYVAGLSDTGTGLLLIFAPAWTLRLMRVNSLPQPIEFAGFIGAFVLSVGLTYLLMATGWPLSQRNSDLWKFQWALTALIRTLVALYLSFQIARGCMELAWITVALSDGTLAGIQWVGLARGWLTHAE